MTQKFHCPDAQTFLRLLHTPGGLVAVRSLHPQEEWHFRREDLPQALPLLQMHSGQRALYACLNPVRADMEPGYADDEDITALRWFPIDADPARPSGTASTDAEKAAAEEVLDRVLDTLRAHIPDLDTSLVRGDSGNGAHALILLPDYPTRGEGAERSAEWKCLKRLHNAVCKRFSTEAVKLDRSILNPSRIWRVYGTLNIKGENTPERPHRMARLLSVPTDLRPLDILANENALLQVFGADTPPAPPHPPAPRGPCERGTSEQGGGSELPPWWTELVTPGDRNNAAYQRARWLLNATEGNRSEEAAWDELRAWNKVVCRPPLTEDELRNTFHSARKAGDNPAYTAPPPLNPPLAGEGGEGRAGRGSWEPPVPLGALSLPPFPLEALPDDLRGYVASAADTLQVPPDLPALLALAVVASAAARVCRVQIGRTHAEPLCQFIAAVLPPGSRKSAALAAMTFPLEDAEREMILEAAPSIAHADETREVAKKRQSHLRDQAAKEKDPTKRAEVQQQLGELAAEMQEVPAAPRLLCDDTTPEKLTGMLADQGGCMALFSSEGGFFGTLAGRYSGEKVNLDSVLKAHMGDGIRVDRQGRKSEFVPYPALTIGLTLQPDVLASLCDTPQFRGRGLLGRFLWAVPDGLVGRRLYRPDAALDDLARMRYGRAVRRVLALPCPATRDDPGARHPLQITGDALIIWAQFADDIERRQADGGDLCGVRDWASKLAGAVARIAGGFHLVEHSGDAAPWTTPISPASVVAACVVGAYLIPHALAAFGQIGADPTAALALRLLRWIERAGPEAFTLRDCHQAHRAVNSPSDLLPALTLLCERGYLRAEESGHAGPGRKPSPLFRVNPLTRNAHNPQNGV